MCNIIRYKSAITLCKRDYHSLSWSSHVLYGAAVLKYFAHKNFNREWLCCKPSSLPVCWGECKIIHVVNQLTAFNLFGDFGHGNVQSLLIYHLQNLIRLLKSLNTTNDWEKKKRVTKCFCLSLSKYIIYIYNIFIVYV